MRLPTQVWWGLVLAVLGAALIAGVDPAPEVAAAVHQQTDGNPFFVVQFLRALLPVITILGLANRVLERTGSDYRGPCPFHGGTHRNFAVIPKKNRYYCFVCHEGGDVFTFVQKRLGMDWPTAVRYVADKAGIDCPLGWPAACWRSASTRRAARRSMKPRKLST